MPSRASSQTRLQSQRCPRNHEQSPGRFRLLLHGASTVVCLVLSLASHAQTALPTGFGPVALGMHWDDVQTNPNVIERTRLTSEWERLVYECGYRSAQLASGDARLLVTTEAFTVTSLSYVKAIEAGSNLMQVAQLVIKNYGQPRQATLRDALGTVTIDQAQANYVTLEYKGESRVNFVVSGAPLWEYRISVEAADPRRAQNRTIRCARTKEKERLNAAAKKSS
ncbi:MAG: hypothetical protein ACI9DC_004104 [Gammaproteobacteria bacterium]|jgi:hypothetical protein